MSLLILKAGTAFSGTATFAPSRGFRPMVAAAASLTSNVGLKIRCELADAVQHAGDPGCLCPSEWLRETGSSLSNGRRDPAAAPNHQSIDQGESVHTRLTIQLERALLRGSRVSSALMLMMPLGHFGFAQGLSRAVRRPPSLIWGTGPLL